MSETNYYLLLELSPEEKDQSKIKAAINRKQTLWSSQRNHPTKGREAQKNLEKLPEIKKVMMDEALRAEQAKAARDFTAKKEMEKFKKIDSAIRSMSKKGHMLKEEFEKLARKFLIPEEELKKRIKVDIVENKPKAPKKLEPTIQKKIADSLKIIEKENLYDFLELSPGSSIDALMKKTKEIARDLKRNSNTGADNTAKKELAGICKIQFKSQEKKNIYDAALRSLRFGPLDKDIDIAGLDEIIDADEFEDLLTKAEKIGLKREEAQDYIKEYCKDNNWSVEIVVRSSGSEYKKCGKCGAANPLDAKNCTTCNYPLEVMCPKCNHVTPAANISCGNCDFSIGDMPKALPLLEEAKEARDKGDIKKAVGLFDQVLLFWPNHPEALTLTREIKDRETKISQLTGQLNTHNPLMHYGIAKVVSGGGGAILALISSITLIIYFITLISNKSYIGNGPYIAAMGLTFSISAVIMWWGAKTLLAGYKEIKGVHIPVPPEFEIYKDVENAAVQKKLQPYETAQAYVTKRDKISLQGFAIFFGIIILGVIGKSLPPDEFFWNLRLKPEYFSFPYFLTALLTLVALVKGASIYFHQPAHNWDVKSDYLTKSITPGVHPDTFAPGIKKKMTLMQQDGNRNMSYYSGFGHIPGKSKTNGKIHGKLFIETHPRITPYIRPAFIYIYLAFAVILTGIGFLFLTKLPPDNISVLTVPTIAIGYIWTLFKGGVLVYCGIDFLNSVSTLLRARGFKSEIAYVDIRGEKEQSLYHFNVFTAELWTEMNNSKGYRKIIKMTEENSAKKLVADAINSFAA